MNDNAKLWVEALESGEFKQVRGKLADDISYCCLGVSCEVYQREVGGLKITRTHEGLRVYDGAVGALPGIVRDWLGLRSIAGSFARGLRSLSGDNDRGVDFPGIAATVRSEPAGLFAEG